MHSEIDEPGIPSGIAIFGSDDTTGEISMLHFDERGVSRRYQITMDGNVSSMLLPLRLLRRRLHLLSSWRPPSALHFPSR
jgi:hypothetical protein